MAAKGFRYVVLGAGREGLAAAFDLLLYGEASALSFLDEDPQAASAGLKKLKSLGDWGARKVHLESGALDPSALKKSLKGSQAAVCALSEKLRPAAAKACVEAGLSYCDLGEDAEVSDKILRMNAAAKKARVTLVPGCGFAPGLSSMLAVYAVEHMDICREIAVYAASLPQNKNLPLGVALASGLGGLLALYSKKAAALRQGRLAEVEPLGDFEELNFPEPLGRLEAFTTVQGLGSGPRVFEKRLKEYAFKTLRYPGHLAQVRSLMQIGFFGEDPVSVEGRDVSPLAVASQLLRRSLPQSKAKDYAVLRVSAKGQEGGRSIERVYDFIEGEDPKSGMGAFERSAGAAAGAAAWMLAAKPAPPHGALAPEAAFKAEAFIQQIRRRGFKIRETLRAAAGVL